MNPNVADWDRGLRLAVAAIAILLAWTQVVRGWPGAALMIVGMVALVSGVRGWCPLYALLGVRTLRDDGKRGHGRRGAGLHVRTR